MINTNNFVKQSARKQIAEIAGFTKKIILILGIASVMESFYIRKHLHDHLQTQ